LNEAEVTLLHATNQHEATELALQERTDELSNMRALLDVAQQEKESATGYGRLKEQEVSQLRIEQARLLQQLAQEKQGRENETAQLKSDVESFRASAKSYEEIASVSRVKAEKLAIELKRLEELSATLEVSNDRMEARLARLTSKLDATTAAKQQVDQSRTAIGARLEAANQLLAERELMIKKLEAKIESINEKMSQAAVLSQDRLDALNARVFELENELAEKRNELALYASQLNVIQTDLKKGKRRG
jgi:chromosome segregation ATPase